MPGGAVAIWRPEGRKKKSDGIWVLQSPPRLVHQTWIEYSAVSLQIINSCLLKPPLSHFHIVTVSYWRHPEGICNILYKYATMCSHWLSMYFPNSFICFSLKIISQREGGILMGDVVFVLTFGSWCVYRSQHADVYSIHRWVRMTYKPLQELSLLPPVKSDHVQDGSTWKDVCVLGASENLRRESGRRKKGLKLLLPLQLLPGAPYSLPTTTQLAFGMDTFS